MRKAILFLCLLAALAIVPAAAAQDDDMMMAGPDVIVNLGATPLAANAGLDGVTGRAHFTSDEGFVHITLELNGATVPEGTVLEGWVVDAGLDGGPGETSVSDADEAFGVSFGNADFDDAVEAAPYALSTGVLTETDPGILEVIFEIPNYYLIPYDAVVITAESDGNSLDGFDPRPGTPVLTGLVAESEPAGDTMMGDDDMSDDDMSDDDMADDDMGNDMSDDDMSDDDMSDDDMMMGEAIEVPLTLTQAGIDAGLEGATAIAQVYVDSAEITITVTLGSMALPEGSVLEGWVVDAGLDGGPGTTNVTDDDEAFGTPFGEAAFDALVESAPYALSTGVLAEGMDDMDMSVLTLTFHLSGYNFSPYDAVVITLESDGNSADGFDPRPGTPVFTGEIGGMM